MTSWEETTKCNRTGYLFGENFVWLYDCVLKTPRHIFHVGDILFLFNRATFYLFLMSDCVYELNIL